MHFVKAHLDSWRNVAIGKVNWKSISYRATSDPINIPETWQINNPSEWINACNDKRITNEFENLETIIRNAPQEFRSPLIRQRNQILSRTPEEVILICQVAKALEPGCAQGKPLRAVSVCGCDSKFFERNRYLLTTLLAARFNEEIKDLKLEKFLDADEGENHWLLICPLDSKLLPFKQLRLRASELQTSELPCRNILVIENERCAHQLPELNDTIAILGAGLNLNWMQGEWLNSKNIALWGDMDTWRLSMQAGCDGSRQGGK